VSPGGVAPPSGRSFSSANSVFSRLFHVGSQ
jgi:hypothetical protein